MDVVMRLPAVLPLMAVLALTPGLSRASSAAYCGTSQWRSVIQEAAARFNIPAQWVDAVMRVESAGCVAFKGQPITSTAGAMGLMQLMPATWKTFRERLRLGDDPYQPRDNILAGTAYLAELHDRYGFPGVFIAYHAGATRYERHLNDGSALPGATLAYLERVERALDAMANGSVAPDAGDHASQRGLFVSTERAAGDGKRRDYHHSARSLFVPLMRARPIAGPALSEREDVQRD